MTGKPKKRKTEDDLDDDLFICKALPSLKKTKLPTSSDSEESDDVFGALLSANSPFKCKAKAAALEISSDENEDNDDDDIDFDSAELRAKLEEERKREKEQKGALRRQKLLESLRGSSAAIETPIPTDHLPTYRVEALPDFDAIEGLTVEPVEENVDVRVRKPDGKKMKFILKKYDVMKKIYEHISAAWNVEPGLIRITRKDQLIQPSDTPLKINYQSDDVLDVVVIESPDEAAENEDDAKSEPEEEPDGNKLTLTVRAAEKETVNFRVAKTDSLSKLHAAFCKRLGLVPEKVKFKWEGDTIDLSQTPEVLDLRDEDVIDVFIAA